MGKSHMHNAPYKMDKSDDSMELSDNDSKSGHHHNRYNTPNYNQSSNHRGQNISPYSSDNRNDYRYNKQSVDSKQKYKKNNNKPVVNNKQPQRYRSPSPPFRQRSRSPSYSAYDVKASKTDTVESKKDDDDEEEEEEEGDWENSSFTATGVHFNTLLEQQVTTEFVHSPPNTRMHAYDTEEYNKIQSIPKPLGESDNINQTELHPTVIANLIKMNCTHLLPIQRYTFPIVSVGLDMCGFASTGCGKTLAFAAPAASKALQCANILRPYFPGSHAQAAPLVLILCPTRELALQIGEQVGRLLAGTEISHMLLIGGVSSNQQSMEINQKQVDIAICTPGRIDEMCTRGKVSLAFVQILILDEADAMLDLGFKDVILSLISDKDLSPSCQTLLFSATFPPSVSSLVPMLLKSPYARVTVSVNAEENSTQNIVQTIINVDSSQQKLQYLKRDLTSFFSTFGGSDKAEEIPAGGQAIIFVNNRRAVGYVSSFLWNSGMQSIQELHGKHSLEVRKQSYLDFRSRRVRTLICTSVAARGLDFPDVGLVINFDLPQTTEVYIHRIGRTGRVGREGKAIAYFLKDTDKRISSGLVAHLKKTNQEVPSWLLNLADRFGRG